MPEFREPRTAPRPTDAQIQEKVDRFKRMKQENAVMYHGSINQFMIWSEGKDEEVNVRQQYYPGWEDEDFKNLLELLGEEV